MKFHFIFLLLIDESSFSFLVFFPFSVLSTIDNAPREHLIENKARFSPFFVFISAFSVKADTISENIYWEISAAFSFLIQWYESVSLLSIAVEKVKMVYQCITFLHTVLRHSFCGCPSISVRPQRNYIFGMSFPLSCLIRLHLSFRSSTPFLPAKRFIRLTGKFSSDMSDASSPQELSEIFSMPSSKSLV